ncbi:unnamed protein product, partial [Prorocentrum cordatum]
AGETSWTSQLGVGVVAYLLLEALKAALRLAGAAVQARWPRRRAELTRGPPPWLEGPEAPDFAKRAAEQARASRSRSQCQAAGPVLWHERLTIGERGAPSYIATPDFDDYDEPNVPGPDVAEVVRLAGQGGNPLALAAGHVHRFRRLPAAAEAWGAVGRAVAAGYPPSPVGPLLLDLAAGNVLGLAAGQRPLANPAAGAAPGDAAPAGQAGAPGAPAAPGALVAAPAAAAPVAAGAAGGGLAGLVAALGGPAAGAGAAAAAGAPAAAGALAAPAAALPAAAPAADAAPAAAGAAAGAAPAAPAVVGVGPAALDAPDLRVLAAARDGRGQRFLDFREGVLAQSERARADFPVRGPRTTHWALQSIQRRGGSPLARHSRWRTEMGLDPDDAGVEVHLSCSRLLETMISRDQLNACDLACGELIARALQVQEERYRARSASAEPENINRNLMMGTAEVRGDVCVAPALQQHVSAELAREVAVQKELRKAREERQLASGASGSHDRDKDKKGRKGTKGEG